MDYCIFNELSLPFDDQYAAQKGLKNFILTHIKLDELGLGKLCLPEQIGNKLFNLELATNYQVSNWLYDKTIDEDLKNKLRNILTDAPFITDDEPSEQETNERSEFKTKLGNQYQIAEGLGAAYLLDTLCLSFLSQPVWDNAEIQLAHWLLEETGTEKTTLVTVKHIAKPKHVALYETWYAEKKRNSLEKAKELWKRREEFFPHIILCDGVKKQLERCGFPLDKIINRLKKLDAYAEKWVQGSYSDKHLEEHGLNVSGESKSTLNKYGNERKFRLPNGRREIFEKHIKTGDLRFHFYPDNETQTIYVGYIGKHLRIVTSK